MTEPKDLAREIARVLDEKKAIDIVAIETEEVTVVSDFFVIASGTSNTHTKALADDVEYEIKKRLDIATEHIEGRATGWNLLENGTVLVHDFDKESVRQYRNRFSAPQGELFPPPPVSVVHRIRKEGPAVLPREQTDAPAVRPERFHCAVNRADPL